VPTTSRKWTKEDFILFFQNGDDTGQVLGHEGKVALAQTKAIHGAGGHIDQALIASNRGHDSANAAQGRERRIVGGMAS